uniref:Uncharacterized protein n=1 Tax=Rangifer tarandus platyrhynchus TaxID=3082113 RepID=A0ACB0E674_RANTA|nr:unnamed protein product [Rangifer tarandus platyrhynchus]
MEHLSPGAVTTEPVPGSTRSRCSEQAARRRGERPRPPSRGARAQQQRPGTARVDTLDRHRLRTPTPTTGRNPTVEKNPSFVRTSRSLSCHYTAKTYREQKPSGRLMEKTQDIPEFFKCKHDLVGDNFLRLSGGLSGSEDHHLVSQMVQRLTLRTKPPDRAWLSQQSADLLHLLAVPAA